MSWAGHVAQMEKNKIYRVLECYPEERGKLKDLGIVEGIILNFT
jgi:hypothetical protein